VKLGVWLTSRRWGEYFSSRIISNPRISKQVSALGFLG
jgi:hypothetical protein